MIKATTNGNRMGKSNLLGLSLIDTANSGVFFPGPAKLQKCKVKEKLACVQMNVFVTAVASEVATAVAAAVATAVATAMAIFFYLTALTEA